MTIDYDNLMNLSLPRIEQAYADDDAIRYALSVGLGMDPNDENQLRFVYEGDGLRALPTLPVVLTFPGSWISDPSTGVNYLKAVHGEHSLELHQSPHPAGRVAGQVEVVDVIDKGAGKGALIVTELQQTDVATGRRTATIRQTTFARDDGGFGGPRRSPPPTMSAREASPDWTVDMPTSPQAALLYRLNADRNPLHADPRRAQEAGYPQPILHGLATFGLVGHALLKAVCGYDPDLFGLLSVRFAAPVYPGETIRTEIWDVGSRFVLQARVLERNTVVISNGQFAAR